MTSFLRLAGICLALVSAACGSDGAVTITGEELAADPESWVGDQLWVEGAPNGEIWCTGAGCAESPCNNCWIRFGYGEPNDVMVVDLAEGGLPEPTWTQNGRLPGGWCTGLCEPWNTGCRGHELALSCAPSVPARIEALHGRLRRSEGLADYELVVDDVRLAPAGPTTETRTVGDHDTTLEEADYDGPRPGL